MITLYAVGNLKEKYLKEGCQDYLTRISRFDKILIKELKEGPTDNARSQESEAILNAVATDEFIFACDSRGKQMDSLQFAYTLQDLYNRSRKIAFVIGGSEGLNDYVTKHADVVLSFSAFTFPHQLFRLVLLEQIYRALKIINNQTYHK